MSTPKNQELIDFIQKSKSNGLTDEQIKSSLKQAGWQENDIEEGFNSSINSPVTQNYFEGSKKTNNLSSKLIITIIIFFILIIGGVFVFYYNNSKNNKIQIETSDNLEVPVKPIERTPENEIKKPQSPKDRFFAFKTAIEGADTYEYAVSLAKQYMSKTTDAKALGYEQINISAEQKKQLLSLLKTTPPLKKDILDVKEETDGAIGKLIISTKDNKLCGLPIFLEDNEWKFGIMDCKEITTAQPSQPEPQKTIQNIITNCGSIKYPNIMNMDDARTPAETDALNCMAQALTTCDSKSLTVSNIQISTYQIEGKENQYCNISRNAGLKTTCSIPLTYISNQRQRYKSPNDDDIFLQIMISSIDAGGKTTNARTGQTTTEFVCQ
jgi:hypothetical protein